MTPRSGLLLLSVLSLACDSWVDQATPRRPSADSGTFVGPGPGFGHEVPRIDVDFGPIVESDPAPVPISGGTLTILSDGITAIASDPDRDLVWIADLNDLTHSAISLSPGDEPGRSVEDGAGRVHVATRRGGAVVTIDPRSKLVTDRRAVCASPRGIAHDPSTDLLHVACQSGHLISLPADGGPPTRTLQLLPDLRDVVVDGEDLWVSRFRSAEVLLVAGDGSFERRTLPDGPPGFTLAPFSPAVAWRMAKHPLFGVIVLHQLATQGEVQIDPNAIVSAPYSGGGDPCLSPMVRGTVTFVSRHQEHRAAPLAHALLAVDIAVSRDGFDFAVAAPGNAGSRPVWLQYDVFAPKDDGFSCLSLDETGPHDSRETIAVAYDGNNRVISQVREPPAIAFPGGEIALTGGPSEPRAHLGHALFHRNAGGDIACASCHPEGGDDGRVWLFSGLGARRTQTMRTALAGTEPFHWDGDMPTFSALAEEVFGRRMLGPQLATEQVEIFSRWVSSIAPWPAATGADPDQVSRGEVLFNDPEVGCATCHAGPNKTNNATVDVATGGAFQVPSLVGVAYRTPLMHNGCAETLLDRFDPSCGGGVYHGQTSHLSAAEIEDLISYLESL